MDAASISMEWLEVVDENDVVMGLERRGVMSNKGVRFLRKWLRKPDPIFLRRPFRHQLLRQRE